MVPTDRTIHDKLLQMKPVWIPSADYSNIVVVGNKIDAEKLFPEFLESEKERILHPVSSIYSLSLELDNLVFPKEGVITSYRINSISKDSSRKDGSAKVYAVELSEETRADPASQRITLIQPEYFLNPKVLAAYRPNLSVPWCDNVKAVLAEVDKYVLPLTK